jgi:UDP-4-amino-4,6-dideoxy-N-acetyl-beta-L-altrosamine transaminase
MKPINYGRQDITEEDIQAVTAVLKSDFLTQGPMVAEFEQAFARYVGARFAVACSNGTSALHLCAMVLGVQPGHNVITTPITFVATANCVRYCGGTLNFADIDRDTYLLDIVAVRRMLESAPRGTYQGVIPVDFAGRPVDLTAWRELADEFGLWIIEDACHAPGGYGKAWRCGDGSHADLAIFSFHPVKHIACGEGGMVTTNDPDLNEKLRNLRTHGIQQVPEKRLHNHGIWYYEMQELGYNYRLTDIQAALGLSQLRRAEAGLERRIQIAQGYADAFEWAPGVVEGHAYHLYVIEHDHRDALIHHLRDRNIFAQVHYIPAHLMPYYANQGYKPGDFPMAEDYYARCLSLPIYPSLSDGEQDYVIDAIKSFRPARAAHFLAPRSSG